ncbi:hypothetical protein HCH_03965 [Hahella chejuensis KCTC 2396]|uniref:Uncharacterized protein n=1 Tax=Hahella chejuensis (strain KCTC 2396) TaxID=349521 RepID=Q2SF90_HAHCH|nr:hypothetical protein HCH_03965 [Hahella chejuensis KCTC 2396]
MFFSFIYRRPLRCARNFRRVPPLQLIGRQNPFSHAIQIDEKHRQCGESAQIQRPLPGTALCGADGDAERIRRQRTDIHVMHGVRNDSDRVADGEILEGESTEAEQIIGHFERKERHEPDQHHQFPALMTDFRIDQPDFGVRAHIRCRFFTKAAPGDDKGGDRAQRRPDNHVDGAHHDAEYKSRAGSEKHAGSQQHHRSGHHHDKDRSRRRPLPIHPLQQAHDIAVYVEGVQQRYNHGDHDNSQNHRGLQRQSARHCGPSHIRVGLTRLSTAGVRTPDILQSGCFVRLSPDTAPLQSSLFHTASRPPSSPANRIGERGEEPNPLFPHTRQPLQVEPAINAGHLLTILTLNVSHKGERRRHVLY